MRSDGALSSTGTFRTETNDYLAINGQRCQGNTGPANVAVASSFTFTWPSDGSILPTAFLIPTKWGLVHKDYSSSFRGLTQAVNTVRDQSAFIGCGRRRAAWTERRSGSKPCCHRFLKWATLVHEARVRPVTRTRLPAGHTAVR